AGALSALPVPPARRVSAAARVRISQRGNRRPEATGHHRRSALGPPPPTALAGRSSEALATPRAAVLQQQAGSQGGTALGSEVLLLMERAAATSPRAQPPPWATENVLPRAEDWTTSLRAERPPDLQLSEEQRLQASEGPWGTSSKEGPTDAASHSGHPQISKELVDLQITAHHLREQHEVELFELRSEVLRLESRVLELELRGDCAAPADTGLGHRQELAQGPGHKAQEQGRSIHQRPQSLGSHSASPCAPRDFLTPKKEQQTLGNSVSVQSPSLGIGAGFSQPTVQLGNGRDPEFGVSFSQPLCTPQLQGEWQRVLEKHRAQKQALETHVADLGRQLQGAREEARTAGQRLAAQATVLSACQGQLRQSEEENAQLQLQLKKLNQEHAVQLQRCARGVAVSTGWRGPSTRVPDAAALRAFLESTLEDIRAAHRSREQQLARAARAYRKRLADLSCRHEELLANHRVQQVLADPRGALGTPKATSDGAISDPEPLPLHLVTEPSRLPENQARLEKQLRKLQAPVSSPDCPALTLKHWPQNTPQPCQEPASWAQIHQKLRDFSRGTQAELERERAQLLVRAVRAEEQLSELQEYVDQHLGSRYKQEILKLRKLMRTEDAAEVGAAPPLKPQHPKTRSR
ncbi:NARFL factor, partial [Crocuta crocuta]